jgi:SAM-dependent methyltransferase
MKSSLPTPEFDQYASEYDEALAQGISVSGEDKDFFAQGRVAWLARCLKRLGEQPASVLDYGCGTGAATPFLHEVLAINSHLGVDVSPQSIEIARRAHSSPRAHFSLVNEYQPAGRMDLAFCNGVFHHIPLAARADAVTFVHRSIRPGGWFAFWENNPWNPGTRYVMSRIPFDRDAITLSPPEARRLLRAGGFEVMRTDFLFVFPRMLGWLRRLEPWLSPFPLGAQYQILCRKPA